MTALFAPEIHRPSLGLFGLEAVRASFELIAHQLSWKSQPPPGDGHPVVIFPGLGADASSVLPLRDHCRRLGYDAMDWGLGRNVGPQGDLEHWLDRLALHVAAMVLPRARPATLIGWSLGGIYARELARRIAPQVRQVITVGTPFNADADHTNAGWLLRCVGGRVPEFDATLCDRLRTPPPVPTVSIYSRTDGVVAWQTCRHAPGAAGVEDIEVDGSHLGLVWNPAVLEIVGERLAPAQVSRTTSSTGRREGRAASSTTRTASRPLATKS